jgi:hypothetical protein
MKYIIIIINKYNNQVISITRVTNKQIIKYTPIGVTNGNNDNNSSALNRFLFLK